MTSRTDGVVVETFEYNEFQQLVRFERTGANPTVVQYRYDDGGLIASRTVDGVTTNYVWDRSSKYAPFLYEVVDATGGLIRRYHNDGQDYVAVEDASGVTMDLSRVTFNGEVFIYGRIGEGTASVPS